MRPIYKNILVAAIVAAGSWQFAGAQATAAATPAQEVPAEEMTIEQTLTVPEVPAKLNPFVKGYMKREALALHKAGYKVETMRKGEIVDHLSLIVIDANNRCWKPCHLYV